MDNGQDYDDGGWDWSGLCDGKGGWIDPVQPTVNISPEEKEQSDKYNAYLLAQAYEMGYGDHGGCLMVFFKFLKGGR